MHAVYLKSVHSPITNKVKFIQHHDVDVFSQVQSENDTQYMEDSFCVGDDYNDDGMVSQPSCCGIMNSLI